MNLGDITTKLATLFGKDSTDFIVAGQDLLVQSLESARKEAERRRKFQLNRKLMSVTIDLRGGGYWTELAEVGYPTSVFKVRNVKKAYYQNTDGSQGREIPFSLMKPDIRDCRPCLYLIGNRLMYSPQPTNQVSLTFQIDAFVWMKPYTDPDVDGSYTDWMIENGFDYLYHAAAFDLNWRYKEFVPRQEGNLMLSTDLIESKFRSLLASDSETVSGLDSVLE